jgi:hypothetical protein
MSKPDEPKGDIDREQEIPNGLGQEGISEEVVMVEFGGFDDKEIHLHRQGSPLVIRP